MAKQDALTFMEFKNRFNNEESCRKHLFKLRWPNGYVCPKCKHQKYYFVSTRNLYECANCHYQVSVTAGTIMDKTRIKLQVWFWAIYFAGKDKRGLSAQMLCREFGISYKSSWLLLHKIRKAMAERDFNYTLAGIVELDDSYFGAPTEGGKRGRGTDKAKVIIGLSLDKKGRPLFIKMEVVEDLKKETYGEFAKKHIESGSKISSDAFSSIKQLVEEGFDLEQKVFNQKEDPDHLKWLHTMVANAKAYIIGTYHGLDEKHLQKYLDEFCYRFNRWKMNEEMFNRIIMACMNTNKYTFTELSQ